jgi:hypothetical protein
MRLASTFVCVTLAFTAGAAVAAQEPTSQAAAPPPSASGVHIRLSQLPYPPDAPKVAVVFADRRLDARFTLADASSGKVVLKGRLQPTTASTWGAFRHHYQADLTSLSAPGRYRLTAGGKAGASAELSVAEDAQAGLADRLLDYIRQQRCGFNPFVGEVCHAYDARTAYGPLPEGSYVDARGGWHDAGDQLKYLLTSSTVTAHLLLAWREAPQIFGDAFDALGRPGRNGRPDVLDEARWGLDWMLRLHPAPDQLYHQVADDRDHIGWKLPHQETSDYGWGPGSYRVVYFADGRPQGLKQWKSVSDGVANLAGRYAAAMALAWQTWKDDPAERAYAERCLRAGVEVYALGRAQEGVQQGNSYGAPYRYAEETWADDMEWGAAELHRATGEARYRDDAVRYARLIGATSWMGRSEAGHYQLYPFMNMGHAALHTVAADALRPELSALYREGLEASQAAAAGNPYGVGVPFIWCSNNLVVALATQGVLFERMSGDPSFRGLVAAQVDWLFGRNPWGVSMFTEIPEGGRFPIDVHLSTTNLTGRRVRGGLVDGPVYRRIFENLKGVRLSRPDPFAAFQGEAVYHDDIADYASNEPTLDGTASAVLLFALLAAHR